MAHVEFRVRHEFDVPPRRLWEALIDWRGHESWIPLTTMTVEPGDPTAVGARFAAFTGVGRVGLDDRMEVATLDWDETTSSGECVVNKLGPVLSGRAGFTVTPTERGSAIEWLEDVDVRYLPRLLAPVASKIGELGFRQGMKRLAKQLA